MSDFCLGLCQSGQIVDGRPSEANHRVRDTQILALPNLVNRAHTLSRRSQVLEVQPQSLVMRLLLNLVWQTTTGREV